MELNVIFRDCNCSRVGYYVKAYRITFFDRLFVGYSSTKIGFSDLPDVHAQKNSTVFVITRASSRRTIVDVQFQYLLYFSHTHRSSTIYCAVNGPAKVRKSEFSTLFKHFNAALDHLELGIETAFTMTKCCI